MLCTSKLSLLFGWGACGDAASLCHVAQKKGMIVMALLLLCAKEDVPLFPSLWVMERESENTAGQGWGPKAMRRLNNIIRGWGCAAGMGNGGGWKVTRQQRQHTATERERRVEQQFGKENREVSAAVICNGWLLFQEKWNDSQWGVSQDVTLYNACWVIA